MREERIIKDLNTISKRLKHEKSKYRISLYVADYIALSTLLNLTDNKTNLPMDFDINRVLNIFNSYVRKEKYKYVNYLYSSIDKSTSISSKVLNTFDESGFYPFESKTCKSIEENKSVDYLIDFMSYMGTDAFKNLKKMYHEDRVGYFAKGDIQGLTTSAYFINSQYITYIPRLDYFDSSIISHEIGHVIHQNLNYERGVFNIIGSVFDETLSQYFEMSYIDYIRNFDENIKDVEASVYRTFYKNALAVNMMQSLLSNGFIYNIGPDFKSMIDTRDGFEMLFDSKYPSIENEVLKDFSYAKALTYFIGMVIALHYLDSYKENPKLGLKELKNFLTTAHIGTFEDKISSIGIDNNDYNRLIRRLNPYKMKESVKYEY